ncbi:hypothetical protein GW933_01375 [Candidatus Falkowbacteria bacterium]|uniref:Uncharacterized protein n=1 Tax=Candidatus Buchananbacteria bacterium CG10_big_fil_rev_8_21_14_0_10_33_19 TaxID=1974525 RepID=A0A2H0W3G5_9BACT|nr:hypothetical protein [Candidatus Falkowbacteria bacterium]PIS05905.1 MAG: hypothetical protein COT80_04005 [Candidatus Buchananbacteria bacterium CG10_big_fil_rev_8_21_14_0_10_33_19]
MGFVLKPEQIFGDAGTSSKHKTFKLLELSLAEADAFQDNWLSRIKFNCGLEKTELTARDLIVGRIFIVIYDSGKIDRFEIIKNRKLKFFLKKDEYLVCDFTGDLFIGGRVILEEFNPRKESRLRMPKGRIKRIILIYN